MGNYAGGSVFDYNMAFLSLSIEDIANKTGIDRERVKLIAAGEEPLLTELVSLSIAFDRGLCSFFAGEWFMQSFGEYYRPDNDFLRKILNKGDIRAVVFIFSSGLVIKENDTLKFVRFGRISESMEVDKELAKQAIEMLLEQGLAQIASQISTLEVYYKAESIDSITFTMPVFKKYLFKDGVGSWNSYFVPLFNGLKSSEDKLFLLELLKKNLEVYAAEDTVLEEDNGAPYVYYMNERDGIKELSVCWCYCDLSLLDYEGGVKDEIVSLQDEIFRAHPLATRAG